MGDEKFFALLNQSTGPAKWKSLAKGWTAEAYSRVIKAPPGDEARTRLALLTVSVPTLLRLPRTV